MCLNCGKQFQSKSRPNKLINIIWKKFVWERRTMKQLSREYKKSLNWIRLKLDQALVERTIIKPQNSILILDATFFKRVFGIMVARSPHLKRNIYWKEINSETIAEYLNTKLVIEKMGFKIKAVVLDGRPGVRAIFNDIPVQMCHFHQKQIIRRYLTNNPKLEANIELKNIVRFLCQTNEEDFTKNLNVWHKKWEMFLKERTVDELNPRRWHYTHKRLRSAYRSLKTNLPYLFTYQDYPKLNIPNTTNSLDGYFSHLKELVKIHRGLNNTLKRKIIYEILAK